MADPKFIHLRVHTAYSLSEGAMKVPALVKKMSEMNIPAFAMTDTANMFGGKAVSKFASDAGIKPILGCQFYLRNPDSDDLLKSKGRIIEPDKIILLVKAIGRWAQSDPLMPINADYIFKQGRP